MPSLRRRRSASAGVAPAQGVGDLDLAEVFGFFRQHKRTGRSGLRLGGAGENRARPPGTSLDFVQLRWFQPGDDVRHIDWRASTIHSELLVRQFASRQRLTTQVVIDCSASMRWPQRLFPVLGPSSHWFASTIAAALAYVLLLRRDRVTLLVPGDAPERDIAIGPVRAVRELPDAIRDLRQLAMPSQFPWHRIDTLGRQHLGTGRTPGLLVLLSDFLGDWNADQLAAARRVAATGAGILAVHIDSHGRELAYLQSLGASLLLTDREDATRTLAVDLDSDCPDRVARAANALHSTVKTALASPMATIVRLDTGHMHTGRGLLHWMRDLFLRAGVL